MSADHGHKRKNRKKKNKRFLHNAKGFGKQGIYGRGTHIDDDQFKYFINILDAMKNGFEETDEKVNMANNVFEQTIDQEVHLASNQIVSKVLESLIGYVNDNQLEIFFEKFADSFRPICSDRFASHVLQKMVEISFLRAVGIAKTVQDEGADEVGPTKRLKTDTVLTEEQYNLETEFTAEHRKNCSNFVLRVSKFVLNNLEDFVWDSCANHIMRTCILSLAGVHVNKVAFEKGTADMAKNRKLYNVSEEWKEVLREFPQRLEMWPHFVDFPYQEHSSALLGVICIALSVVDKSLLKHIGKKILIETFLKFDNADNGDEKIKIEILDEENESKKTIDDENEQTDNTTKKLPTVPKVFQHQSSVILLETMLTVAGAKLMTQLYAMLFTGRVSYLAQTPLTNFAVQKLLQYIKEKDDFESIYTELHEHIEELLKIGHTGVVAALSAACLRLATKQAQLLVSLQKAMHVDSVGADKEKTKLFFNCLLKLKPYEVMLEDKSTFVHLHGSLIVQHILQFNKPIFLVNCILERPADQLIVVFNTPNGSHIVDAFLQSKYIGEKSREKLIRHLEGFYVDLAITKHGSRAIERLFDAAQDTQKSQIAKELSDKSNMLKGTPFGRLVHSKLRIETYRLSSAQWKASLGSKPDKVDQLFKNIIK